MNKNNRNQIIKYSVLNTLLMYLNKTPGIDHEWLAVLNESTLLNECKLFTKSVNFDFKLNQKIGSVDNPKSERFVFKYIRKHFHDCYKFISEIHLVQTDEGNVNESKLITDIYLSK